MTRRFALAAGILMTIIVGSCAEVPDKPIHVGISQIVEHPALDSTRKGFTDELAERGYVSGKNISYDYKNAQNNRPVSVQIARKFVGDDVDLILAISTPSSQDAAAATEKIPILFAAVTDPVSAGLVKSLEKARRQCLGNHGSVTGISTVGSVA